jgi:hypothetical protein
MNDHPTFEETYPKYEFSELVRLGLALAAWTLRVLHRARALRPDASATRAAETELRAS